MLAVVHNTTAATRLFDILPLFAEDPRIQTVFTCPGSSAFTAGTTEFLARAGIGEVLPWAQAVRRTPDFAIAASYGGDLHEIKAPLMVVPHGMGYNKYLEHHGQQPVFGLSSPWLLHRGELVPSIIVLSHPEQLARLTDACPQAARAALVAGDPCFDRMLASLPLRETYRQAFGIGPRQRLVVISSTWGDSSLYGKDPGLIRRLAARLDLDRYRLAVALHPNIAGRHSRWQVRQWLSDCERAGVLVLPSEELWAPALVAADLTIGDHGSVSFYSAALGTPLLLASAPEHKVDPRSPIGQLLAVAPKLDRQAEPAPQLERALADHERSPITRLTTSRPGQSAKALREAIYRGLDLPAPRTPAETWLLPVPTVSFPSAHAQLIDVDMTTNPPTVTRYPADALREPQLLPENVHLVVHTRETNTRLLDLADIVLHDRICDPAHWIARTLRELPGCHLAVARDERGWMAGDAERLLSLGEPTAPIPALAARLLYDREPGLSRIRLGDEVHTVRLTELTPTRQAAPEPIRPAG